MKAIIILLIICATMTGCASVGDAVYDFVSSDTDTSTRSTRPAPRTHREMMCAADPLQCKGLTPNRTQPRTHREMMCAANPFEC